MQKSIENKKTTHANDDKADNSDDISKMLKDLKLDGLSKEEVIKQLLTKYEHTPKRDEPATQVETVLTNEEILHIKRKTQADTDKYFINTLSGKLSKLSGKHNVIL